MGFSSHNVEKVTCYYSAVFDLFFGGGGAICCHFFELIN